LDLAITSDKYEAEKVVKLYDIIKEITDKKESIPVQLPFQIIEEDYTGFY
jgi:hypothetical protein